VAAIAWVKAGVHIRLVSRWLGHRSLAMTMRYTDYEPDGEAAVEMAERAAQTLNRPADVTPLRERQA
jgi:integrase